VKQECQNAEAREVDGHASANESFDEFRHELKSQLSIIRGRARLAALLEDPERLKASMEAISATCTRIEQLIYRYLLYSSSTNFAGASKRVVRASDIIRSLERIAADFRVLSGLERGLEIDVNDRTGPDLRDAELSADEVALEQAVFNLVDNAVKYSFRDSKVGIFFELSPEREIVIRVTNTGLAMTTQDIEASQERGWRSAAAAATVASGQGIGLWIARLAASAHGGQLKISPTDLEGVTSVALLLPLVDPQQ